VVALARPQTTRSWSDEHTEGIDIMLAVDISESMRAMDLKPNRIEAAKNAATEFISGRQHDRIGLVIFAAESFALCPITSDHVALTNLLQGVKIGLIDGNQTAIGSGLASSIQRLRKSEAISKVIILLTDGENNAGDISPKTAADMALQYGIRVYTIGVGTEGEAPMPVGKDFFGRTVIRNVPVRIDEDLLKEIASSTDGKYFRAKSRNALNEIYEEIDKMEKSKIEVLKFSQKEERYHVFVLLAALAIVIEILLRNTVLRTIP
jgi:Ca-activated chloride channel family protein